MNYPLIALLLLTAVSVHGVEGQAILKRTAENGRTHEY